MKINELNPIRQREFRSRLWFFYERELLWVFCWEFCKEPNWFEWWAVEAIMNSIEQLNNYKQMNRYKQISLAVILICCFVLIQEAGENSFTNFHLLKSKRWFKDVSKPVVPFFLLWEKIKFFGTCIIWISVLKRLKFTLQHFFSLFQSQSG